MWPKRIANALIVLALLVSLYEGLRFALAFGHPGGSSTLFPPLLVVLVTLRRDSLLLLDATCHTLTSVVLSLALAVPIGVALAVIMNHSARLRSLLLPLLITIKSLPAVSLLPIFALIFRSPLPTQIALTVSICFLPITLATIGGLRTTKGPLRNFALSSTNNHRRIFWLITFPSAVSEILLGLRISLPLAFVGSLVADMSGGGTMGLGRYILTVTNQSQFDRMMAGVVTVALVSTGVYALLILVIQRLYPVTREVWL